MLNIMKAVGTLLIILTCILFFPIAVGIFGGVFGLIAGIFGGIIGLIGGIFSAMFSLLHVAFHIGAFTILVCLIIMLILRRRSNTKQ